MPEWLIHIFFVRWQRSVLLDPTNVLAKAVFETGVKDSGANSKGFEADVCKGTPISPHRGGVSADHVSNKYTMLVYTVLPMDTK